MNTQVAIEFNDSGIIVSDGEKVLQNSPGYIVKVAGNEWFGKDARRRAYLHPNECNNRFWSELAQTEDKNVNHANAKLALRHLSSVWEPMSLEIQAVVLIVPANFTKIGLGLLLGLCKQLSMPVCAMIHQAVLVPKQSNHEGLTLHLDMQLHHTALTLVQERNHEFGVSAVEILDDIGFELIYKAAAGYIAKSFIHANRLDPMHSAELEQQLFDCLPTWLGQAQSESSVNCELNYQKNSYQTNVNAEDLKTIIESHLNEIFHVLRSFAQDRTLIVCVSEIVDEQLGFTRYANQHGLMVRKLPVGYHAHQSLMHAKKLINDDAKIYLNKQLPYVTVTDPIFQPDHHQYEVMEQSATHVVFRYRAIPILHELYVSEDSNGELHFENEQSSESQKVLFVIRQSLAQIVLTIVRGKKIQINHKSIQSGALLDIGDCLQIGSHKDELLLIKVEH